MRKESGYIFLYIYIEKLTQSSLCACRQANRKQKLRFLNRYFLTENRSSFKTRGNCTLIKLSRVGLNNATRFTQFAAECPFTEGGGRGLEGSASHLWTAVAEQYLISELTFSIHDLTSTLGCGFGTVAQESAHHVPYLWFRVRFVINAVWRTFTLPFHTSL